ncbi:MAG TPA: bifunctional DNA-formamidopyrimidine glycosylase/DNA-(apurinic or apyrimidinic site) lyase [Ilumatobacteraceae bacterium]|nr:bifunctional DNA-formamidopyrimidine glycosylase/DNA-(apurinic or apyrimidinic site) lyase [Ilumatobacteraceae bacterium]
MPELPEVETVRRGLARFAVGRRVDKVEIGRLRTVRRTSAQAIVDGLTGATIVAANRRGKYLLLPLDTGDEMMIHLRMTGKLLVAAGGSPRPPHTHVVMHLDDGNELLFVDPRTFGEVVVFDPTNVAVELPELAVLGIDPVADGLTLQQLRHLVRSRNRGLKQLLLDQHLIAGIGNIYADEILHAARLRPERVSSTLAPRSETMLHRAIHDVLVAAIVSGGSTLRDNQYVDLFGDGGSYQEDHRVYGRAGERCVTCGRGWVRRIVVGQRSTHFCPICQH